jgi:hypothetical protein
MQALQQLMSQPQAAQQAAPSAQQPGGGVQSIGGFTPQQQELLAKFNMFIAVGKQLCTLLDGMNEPKEAAELNIVLGKETLRMTRLQDDFKEEAMEANLMSGGNNAQQQAQTTSMS